MGDISDNKPRRQFLKHTVSSAAVATAAVMGVDQAAAQAASSGPVTSTTQGALEGYLWLKPSEQGFVVLSCWALPLPSVFLYCPKSPLWPSKALPLKAGRFLLYWALLNCPPIWSNCSTERSIGFWRCPKFERNWLSKAWNPWEGRLTNSLKSSTRNSINGVNWSKPPV